MKRNRFQKAVPPGQLLKLMVLIVWIVITVGAKAQKINVDFKRTPLKQVLAALEKQSGYFFLYDENVVNNNMPVDITTKELPLMQVLNQLSEKYGFSYKIVNNTVALFLPEKAANNKQEIFVTGTVSIQDFKSKSNTVVLGATVTVKGQQTVVSTDAKGAYRLQAPAAGTLIFSYVGYQTQEVAVNNQAQVNVLLIPNVGQLEEVIVSGYGIKEAKANQVGSAFMVTAKDLQKKPADRIDRLLEGVVPGLEFQSQDETNSSARPRFSTRVRGEASAPYGTSSNEPLWVIDGVPLYTGGTTNMMPGVETSVSPLSYINPEDIESITVLKDASATTIYGANGSNGVIYITTKKGSGRNRFNYNYRVGINEITDNRFMVMNTAEYNEMLMEMGLGNYVNNVSTDWYDIYFGSGLTQQHNFSLSGKSGSTSHYLSFGLYDEKSSLIANRTRRYTVRMNIDQEMGKRLTAFFNAGGAYTANKIFNSGQYFYTNRPNISAYNADGTYALYDDMGGRIMNSIAEANQNDYNQNTMSVNGNAGATVKLIPGLTFKTINGIDYSASMESEYRSNQNLSGMSQNGYARRAQSTVMRWLSSNIFNYSGNIADGKLEAVLGMEASETFRKSVNAYGSNFANDWIREISYAPDESRRGGSSASEASSLSYFARGNYVWREKLAFIVNYRRDGDSNFGKEVKWGNFSSVGLAWTLSREKFWKSDLVNFAKIKLSYGTIGNSRFNGAYAKGVYSFSSQNSYDGNPGAIMSRGMNDVLKWETTYVLNAGVDVKIADRVDIGVEYYSKITDGFIDEANVSLTTGQRRIYQNVGKISNKGVEIVTSVKLIEGNDWLWNTRVNLSHNRNKVLKLANGIERGYGTAVLREGEHSKAIYLVRWAGVDPRDGAPLWYDARGNVTRIYDPANRVVVGVPSPDFYGGLSNDISYKNFSLSVLILYSKGGYAISEMRRRSESDGLSVKGQNQSKNLLDRWRKPGDIALYPRLSEVTQNSSLYSTRYLHDKTNVRLHNMSLNYNVTGKWLKKVKLTGLSFYVQADNIAIWTPYKVRSDRNTFRNSFDSWPMQRTISLGVNTGF